jgi:hypothetical protein
MNISSKKTKDKKLTAIPEARFSTFIHQCTLLFRQTKLGNKNIRKKEIKKNQQPTCVPILAKIKQNENLSIINENAFYLLLL